MITLNPEQRKHYASLRWLIQGNGVAEGRSFLMAVLFIQKAFDNLGQRVEIFDHSHNGSGHFVTAISNAFSVSDLDDYKLSIIGQARSHIMIQKKTDEELEKDRLASKAELEKQMEEDKKIVIPKPVPQPDLETPKVDVPVADDSGEPDMVTDNPDDVAE